MFNQLFLCTYYLEIIIDWLIFAKRVQRSGRAFPPVSSGDCTLLNDRTRAKMTDSETVSVSSASFHRVSKSMEPRPQSRCRILYHHKCCPYTIQNHTCSPLFSSPNIPSLWSLVFFFMIWSLQECHIME